MKLVVQTSSGIYTVGLIDNKGVVLAHARNERRPEARDLGALVSDVLGVSGCDHAAIEEINVDVGPGGLASTRSGVSFANALAYAGKTRLYGASALELIMLEVRKSCAQPLLCMRPAPGGLAYWAFYVGCQLETLGCDLPVDAIKSSPHGKDRLALAGALDRIDIDPSILDGIDTLDVNLAGPDCFARATLMAAPLRGAIQVLEPVTSIDGLRHDRA